MEHAMSIDAGDVREISYGNRTFQVITDNNTEITTGGLIKKETKTTGNGDVFPLFSMTGWSIKGVKIAVDVSKGELRDLKRLNRRAIGQPTVITLVTGTTYTGSGGHIIGEVPLSTEDGSVTLDIMGSGEAQE